MDIITYGPGGYRPDLPDGNIIDRRTVPDPEPSPVDATPAPSLDASAVVAALSTITPSSTSTAIRTALLALRSQAEQALNEGTP